MLVLVLQGLSRGECYTNQPHSLPGTRRSSVFRVPTDLSCESNNKPGEFLVFLGIGVFLNLSNDPRNIFAEKSNDTILNILLSLQATGNEK